MKDSSVLSLRLDEFDVTFEMYDFKHRDTWFSKCEFNPLAEWLARCSLRSLTVRGGQLTLRKLRQLLLPMKASLRRLTLICVSLKNPQEWRIGLQ